MAERQGGSQFGPIYDRDVFNKRFGDVYEHSPWIAEKVADDFIGREGIHIDALAEKMSAAVNQAGREQQLALLRAHPDLAGRLALRGELTDASSKEQTAAGLDQCTPDEFRKFQRLNTEYTTKFGFPFIIAVTGKNRRDILQAFEKRLSNSPEEEFSTALSEVHKIAYIRLKNLRNAEARNG